MKRPELRLLRTSAVRLAIKSILLYGLILLLSLSALYWASSSYIDKQVEAELEAESSQLQQLYTGSGANGIISYIELHQQDKNHIYYYESADGLKLAGNILGWPDDLDITFDGTAQASWINDEVIPIDLHDDDAYWPVVVTLLQDGSRLLIARNVKQAEVLLELSEFLLEAISVTVVFATLIAVLMGRKILKRMDIISATASEIMLGDMSQRVPLSNNNDEFDTLARRLNAMLDRIQQLIKGIRDVTDNIAHDLRSPLSRMRSQMEIALLEPRSQEEYQQILRNNIADIDGLIRTFNALLSIAQTEAGNHRTRWTKVNLKQLALDLIELYTPLAENKNQQLELINGYDSHINGSRDLLAQSLGNLLENAIKYTPNSGHITLHIKTTADRVEVIVADTGPGIPVDERTHVLEKFVRLDSARNNSGNGLGLSLVAAVAGLHKAELMLEDAEPGLRVIQRFNKVN